MPKHTGANKHGVVGAVLRAFGDYVVSDFNPDGGCGYYDADQPLPYRVRFRADCEERFATLKEAVKAAEKFAGEMRLWELLYTK